MAKTPTNPKKTVQPQVDAAKQEPVTKLAEAPNGAPTEAELDKIAGKDRDPKVPEESANADVAETLKENAKKSADDEPRGYFHGQGGAFGV